MVMGPEMNCFEWHNRASDYLDGTLMGTAKRDADEHLDGCKECSDRHKHYRLILTSIASQPRSALPIPIRKAPLSATLPRMDLARLGRTRWEQVPWYIRTTVEGTSIVLLILLGISNGPKLRALFERNLEKNLSEFNETVSASGDAGVDTASLNLPLSRGKPLAGVPGSPDGAAGASAASGDAAQAAGGDEFASEGNDEESSAEGSGANDGEDSDLRAGNSEIWRINMKTDSPHEMRPKIVVMLTGLNIPSSTPGLGGIEAPGGIQFDLMVPQSVVPSLKKQLQKLAPPTPDGLSGSPVGETFTWYKTKSKHPIPAGLTHVVIWLSQM